MAWGLLVSGCDAIRGNYVGDRIGDAFEVIQLRVGYGIPLCVHAKASDLVSLGFGMSTGKNLLIFGKGERWAEEHHSGIGPNQAQATLFKYDGSFNWYVTGWHHAARHPVGDPDNPEFEHGSFLFVEHHKKDRAFFVDLWDISVGISLGLNLEIGFSGGQFLDALLGLALIDIAGDDLRPKPKDVSKPIVTIIPREPENDQDDEDKKTEPEKKSVIPQEFP